jgi:hypothetical protein
MVRSERQIANEFQCGKTHSWRIMGSSYNFITVSFDGTVMDLYCCLMLVNSAAGPLSLPLTTMLNHRRTEHMPIQRSPKWLPLKLTATSSAETLIRVCNLHEYYNGVYRHFGAIHWVVGSRPTAWLIICIYIGHIYSWPISTPRQTKKCSLPIKVNTSKLTMSVRSSRVPIKVLHNWPTGWHQTI